MSNKLNGLTVSGEFVASGTAVMPNSFLTNANVSNSAAIARSKLALDSSAKYAIPLPAFRTWDDLTSALPGTAASDDLGLIEGTFGTDFPTIQTSDAKATTVTQRTRILASVPQEYGEAETVALRIRGGMITTISDATATVDVEVYLHDDDGSVGSDLCTTAATTINSLTKANVDFAITSTDIDPGDQLDIRVTVAITDSATGTAVIGEISEAKILFDVRG